MQISPTCQRHVACRLVHGKPLAQKTDPLLDQIEAFLKITRIPPSRFGRDVAHDPRLVFDLARGRVPGEALRARVLAVVKGLERDHD